DSRTRPAVEQNLVGFGDTLTTRGSSLNDTFAALPELLGRLTPVARYLSAPSTELTRLFSSLNSFFGTISPVAEVNLRLFADQATALEAGIQVLPRTPGVNVKLEHVLSALKSLAQAPGTNMAVNGLSQTVRILQPMIRYLGPFITVCNGFNYVWAQLGDVVSEQGTF